MGSPRSFGTRRERAITCVVSSNGNRSSQWLAINLHKQIPRCLAMMNSMACMDMSARKMVFAWQPAVASLDLALARMDWALSLMATEEAEKEKKRKKKRRRKRATKRMTPTKRKRTTRTTKPRTTTRKKTTAMTRKVTPKKEARRCVQRRRGSP